MKAMTLRRTALCSLSAVFLAALSTAAHAADCTLRLNDGNVDYGQLDGQRVGEASTGTRRSLATASRTLTATCKSDTLITVKLDGTDLGEGVFKLGEIADYTLTITQMTLDGKAVQVAKSVSGTPAVPTTMPASFRPGETVTPILAEKIVAGSRLDISLRIDAFRARGTSLSNAVTVTSQNQFLLVNP